MTASKEFRIEDIISTMTGRLVGKISGVYNVCSFMSEESVFTHQLPRVSRECRPAILRQHPQLEPVLAESESVTRENWRDWVNTWAERYGGALLLSPMAEGEHLHTHPVKPRRHIEAEMTRIAHEALRRGIAQ